MNKENRASTQRGRRGRKSIAFGFTAATALVVGASMAFACVQTRGRITLTGSLGTKSWAIGNGIHPGPGNVEYCSQPRVGARVPQPTGFGPSQRPDVIVAVTPETSAKCGTLGPGSFSPGSPNTMSDGSYEVMYCDGTVFERNANGVVKDLSSNASGHGSCYFYDSPADRGVLIGFLSIGAGSGSGTYKIPGGAAQNGPDNWAGVAVRRCGTTPSIAGCASATPQTGGGPPHVNMAPISII